MKKLVASIAVLLVVCVVPLAGCPSGGNIPKGWTYKPDYANQGTSIVQTGDNGFFVVGRGLHSEDSDLQTFATKTDAGMTMEWSHLSTGVFPVGNGYVPSDLLGIFHEGLAILAGADMHHGIESNGKTRLRVQAMDAGGALIWDNIYSPVVEWEPNAIAVTGDAGYLVVADETIYPSTRTILLKIDSNGQQLWQKSFGEGSYQRVRRAKLLNGGAMALGGITISESTSSLYDFDFLLAKVDPSGDIVWRREYNQAGRQEALGLGLMPDGGFVLAGTDQGKPYVMRTDPEGEVLWARHDVMGFEPTQNDYSLYDVAVGPGDSITIVGYGQTLGTAGPLPTVSKTRFVMQLDGDGNNRWTTDIRPTYGYGITYTTEGTYMVCGTAFTRQGQVLNLIELDQTGRILD